MPSGLYSNNLIEDVFSESKFNLFRQFCKEKGIVFIHELTENVINDFKSYPYVGITKYKEVIKFLNQIQPINQGEEDKYLNSHCKNIREIEDVLGSEMLAWCQNNKSKVSAFYSIFTQSIKEFDHYINIRSAIKRIHTNNYIIKIGILSAIMPECGDLVREFESCGIEKIQDLIDNDLKINLFCKNIEDTKNLSKAISYLSVDLQEKIKNELSEVITYKQNNVNRNIEVLLLRASGETLESIGKKLGGISRERIRQIERKYLEKIVSFTKRYQLLDILKNFSHYDWILYENEICDFFGREYGLIISYALKDNTNNYKGVKYIESVNGFLINCDVWLNEIERIAENLPDEIQEAELCNIIQRNLLTKGISLNNTICETVLMVSYKKYGKWFIRGNVNLARLYKIIMKKYYPDGLHIYSEQNLNEFKMYLYNEFGDVTIPENDRAIYIRIADGCILRDRGTYIPPECAKISSKLLNDIAEYIDNAGEIIYVSDLFQIFKNRLLEESNIDNHYYLYGVLQYHFKYRFEFMRDRVAPKSITGSSCEPLESFLFELARPVHKSEIFLRFPGMTEAKLGLLCQYSEVVIPWDINYFVNAAIFEQFRKYIKKLHNLLKNKFVSTGENYISAKEILLDLNKEIPEFLSECNITKPTNIFYLLSYWFKKDFYFRWPLIWITEPDEEDNLTILIKRWMEEDGFFSRSKFLQRCDEYGISQGTFYSYCVNRVYSYMIQIDPDSWIPDNGSIFNDKVIEEVKNEITHQIKDRQYLLMGDFDYTFLPTLFSYEWTPFIVQSLIKLHIPAYQTIPSPLKDTRYPDIAIVHCGGDINNIEQLVLRIVSDEFSLPLRMTQKEFEHFLQRKNIIIRHLPVALLKSKAWKFDDEGYVYFDQN